MADEKHALIREWFEEVWNKGNLEAIDRLMAPDAIEHGLTNAKEDDARGPAAFKPFVTKFKEAFPDLRIEVEQTVCEGEFVVARCVVRGTHNGEGLGMLPSNRPIEITGMTMVRVRDGQMVEGWNNFDMQTLMAQITG